MQQTCFSVRREDTGRRLFCGLNSKTSVLLFTLGDLLRGPNLRADVLFRGADLLPEQRTSRHRQAHAGMNLLIKTKGSFMLRLYIHHTRICCNIKDVLFTAPLIRVCVFSGGRHWADQGGAPETRSGQEPGHGYRQRGNCGNMSGDIKEDGSSFAFFFVLYIKFKLSNRTLW